MKCSRRSFLLGSASALAFVSQASAGLGLHGSAATSASGSAPIVVNAGQGQFAFLNIAKGLQLGSAQVGWPGILDANLYPNNGAITSNITNNVSLDATYYGHYLIYWTESGSPNAGFSFGGPGAIVYNGGASVYNVTPSNTGSAAINFGMAASNSTPVSVEFAFGAIVASIANNGGNVQLTSSLTNAFNTAVIGSTYQLNNFTNLPAGIYTVTAATASTITINLAFNGSYAVIGGSPGAASEAILSLSQATWNFFGTPSNMSNFVWCKKADNAAILAGQLASSIFVNALSGTKAAYYRFMDLSGVQDIAGASYANRNTPTSMTWAANLPPSNWGGALTNTADAFTCSNPSGSGGGAYADGEVVIAQVGGSGANTTQIPTLNVGSRGAKKIYTSSASQLNLTFGGSVPVTASVISLVFTGGGLASPFTYNYTTSTSVNGPGGVVDTSFANIAINIRADINGNVLGNAGALVTAGISCTNPTISGALAAFLYNPNINSSGSASLGAGMTITGSDNHSSGTYTFGLMQAGYLPDSTIIAFTFNALVQGWIAVPGSLAGSSQIGGLRAAPPLEFYAEVCSRGSAGMWLNVGIIDQPTTIYSTVLKLAQLGVSILAVEFGNETWNFGESSALPCQTLGACLGLLFTSERSLHGFVGLRVVQMAAQVVQAWSDAGRTRSQLKIVNAYQFVDMNTTGTTNTAVYRFNGSDLNASGGGTNVTLKAFGGAGATAITTNYSTAPNRPADWSDWASPAPYWMGQQLNAYGPQGHLALTDQALGSLTATNYSGLLTASNNWVNGNSTQKTAALDFLYSTGTLTGNMYTLAAYNQFNGDAYGLKAWALGSGDAAAGYWGIGTFVASFDASRAGTGTSGGAQLKMGVACYEGGTANGPVANAGDLTNLTTDLTNLGDNSTSFGGTGVPATDAANIATLYEAFRNDARYGALVTRYLTEFRLAVRTVSTRDAIPAWFGFEGPGDFALYPGSIETTPYQSYNALATFN